MHKKRIILFLLLLPIYSFAQKDITISGFIKDKSTGEVLIGANIWIEDNSIGTSTNEYGYYSLQIPIQKQTISFSYVGFENLRKEIHIQKDSIFNVELSNFTFEEIVISAQKNTIANQGLNQLNIPVKQLMDIPSIGGETDIMKALSLFPGISIGQEGTSSLYVRGGTPDQNLILLDGIPVYNASHLGGFFSTFNGDAINNIDVIRGGIPAQYGGRLSSVIDITMREGSTEKFTGSVGTGLLTSHILLEGPLKDRKGSYLFASRISYLGLINLFSEKKETGNHFNYWLYDINFKTNLNLKKGKLYFSFYNNRDVGNVYSRDIFYRGDTIHQEFFSDTKVQWGNTTISTRYTLPIRSTIFAKILLGYTTYQYQLDNVDRVVNFTPLGKFNINNSFLNESKVEDWIGRVDFDYNVNPRHYLKFGLGATLHQFSTFSSARESSDNDKQTNHDVEEYFIYLQDKLQFSKTISAIIGVRWEAFNVKNNFQQKVEPRISIKYKPTNRANFTASFSTTQQYLHLLQNNGFGLPNDIWVPFTEDVPAQNAYQFTLGNSYDLSKKINLTTEVYYKKTNNVIDYKPGLDEDIYNQIGEWEKLVETGGIGESYGLEMLLQKDNGKVRGYLSYTLSWNFRQFENINQGNKYPFTYDRRHDIALVVRYPLSKKTTLTGNWIFQSGTAVTLPIASAPFPESRGGSFTTLSGESIPTRSIYFIYDEKNNKRLPSYNRTDLGIEYKRTTKNNNKFIWKFSIYNLFNIQNPSYLRFRGSGGSYTVINGVESFEAPSNRIQQVSLFTIIPGFSFHYKF